MKKYLFIAEKPSLMREVEKTYKKNKKEIDSIVGEIDFISLSRNFLKCTPISSFISNPKSLGSPPWAIIVIIVL